MFIYFVAAGLDFQILYSRLENQKVTEQLSEESKAMFRQWGAEKAHKIGVAFDPRTVQEVISDEEKMGYIIYPMTHLSDKARFTSEGILQSRFNQGGEIYPFGQISHSLILYCSEGMNGVYNSDRFGFRNPDRVWDMANTDAMLLGGNYGLGKCLPERLSVAGHLAAKSLNVINLSGPNGPLSQLAALREYGSIVKPRFIVWFQYEGNIARTLNEEKKSPFLLQYIKPNFSQHLADRQEEIDRKLKNFHNEKRFSEASSSHPLSARIIDAILLRNIRHELQLGFRMSTKGPMAEVGYEKRRTQLYENRLYELDVDLYGSVLKTAKSIVSEWGGKIIIAQPVGYYAYCDRSEAHYIHKFEGISWLDKYTETCKNYNMEINHLVNRKLFRKLYADNNLFFVDIHSIMDSTVSNGTPIFYHPISFYTSELYEEIAEEIFRSINSRTAERI